MLKQQKEIEFCKIFLEDPTRHPNDLSKSMKPNMGPYNSWVDKCYKYQKDLDLSNLVDYRIENGSLKRETVSRSPKRSNMARSPKKSNISKSYYREREIELEPREKNNNDLILKSTLRPLKYEEPNLLSRVELTVEDFDRIKNYFYDKFIDEVIKITNENGGNITKHYLNDTIAIKDIIVEIPKKYTSKQSGNDKISFSNGKGITNGKLLYSLVPYIRSNYPDYHYFVGLKQEQGNIYKLMINYEGW